MDKNKMRIAAGVLAALLLIGTGYFITMGLKGKLDQKEVRSLIEGYYSALERKDEEALKSLITVPENAAELIQASEMVEGYEVLECYPYAGNRKGEFITYVEYKMKFNNIETPASSLSAFYMVPSGEGALQIFVDELPREYREAVLKTGGFKEVEALKKKVNESLEAEIAFDEELKNFFMIISGE